MVGGGVGDVGDGVVGDVGDGVVGDVVGDVGDGGVGDGGWIASSETVSVTLAMAL